MYIKLENNVPTESSIDQWELFKRFPNVSFVIPITPQDLAPFSYGVVRPTPTLTPDKYEICVEDTPQKDETTDYWNQTWKIIPMSQLEKDEVNAKKSEEARLERNKKLLESDWTQLPDSIADKLAWVTYRQALRDITAQTEFPWNISWPVKP